MSLKKILSTGLYISVGGIFACASNIGGYLNNIQPVQQIQNTISSANIAGSASNILNSNIFTGSQTVSIPGVSGLNIECDIPKIANLPTDLKNPLGSIWKSSENAINNSVNSATNNAGSLLEQLLNKVFSTTGCKITPKVQQACSDQILSNSKNEINNLYSNLQSDENNNIVTLTPVNSVFSGSALMGDFGNIATMSYTDGENNPCASVSPSTRFDDIPIGSHDKTIGYVYKNDFSSKNILSKGLTDSGAKNIFDPKLYAWKQCVLSHPDTPDVCKAENYRLPQTFEKVQEEIYKGKTALSDGTETSDAFDNSLLLANNYIKQCSNSDNEAECEDNIYKNGMKVKSADGSVKTIKLQDEKLKKKINIEKATTTFTSMLRDIENEDSTFAFMSEDMAQTVSFRDRAKFRNKARIEMEKRALEDHFIDRIKFAKEEIVDIEQNLVKVSASQFNEKEAKQEVKAIVASFDTGQN